VQPVASGKHGAARRGQGRELHHADRCGHIIVNCLYPAPEGIGFVPEARASRIAQKIPPLGAVRFGAGPAF
jgi:hypothetical protein